MRQATGGNRMLNLVFVSGAGLGGLLAFTAVSGNLAWWMWSPGNRRAFLALVAGGPAVGTVIHLLPHAPDDGVDKVGLPLAIVALVVEGYLLLRPSKRENGSDARKVS